MLKAFKKIAFCFALATCAFSCAVVSFEELEAEISLQEKQNYYEHEHVRIGFSIEMEKTSVENLVSLKEDGKRLEAKIEWQNNLCLIKAPGDFKKGCAYVISLQGDAYTKDGRKYSLNIYREFIFGKETETFKLLNVEEEKDLNGDVICIRLVFNNAIDPSYFEREFNISPYIEVKIEYSKDFCVAEISPSDKWKANVYYSWSVKDIFSKSKVKLFREYSSSFLGAKKDKPPEITNICPVIGNVFLLDQKLNDLMEAQGIGLEFDCLMNPESVERGVNFTPSIQGFWTNIDSRKFIFTPYKNYQINKEYRLSITDSVEDKWGIKIKEDRNIYFTPAASFIKVDKATFNTNNLVENQINQIEAEDGLPSYIKVFFDKPLSKKSLSGIKNSIKLDAVFPSVTQTPRLNSINLINESCVELSYSNLSVALPCQECIYKLTVRGGENFIYDNLGECLKEDKCFYININKN